MDIHCGTSSFLLLRTLSSLVRYIGYDYRRGPAILNAQGKEGFDYMAVRRLHWIKDAPGAAGWWPTIWQPIDVQLTVRAGDATMGKKLGIELTNVGEDGSIVAFDMVTATVTKPDGVKGCDGIEGSGKSKDACGVCGGDGKSCLGCDNVANSGKINDKCGVCGGDDSTCKGCDGVPLSGKTEDVCKICGGDGKSCLGCDGVVNSGKKLDACGKCGGDGKGCKGCDNVANSGKTNDKCGVCGGDDSTCKGCDGVPLSGKNEDVCNICGGDGTSCKPGGVDTVGDDSSSGIKGGGGVPGQGKAWGGNSTTIG